MTILANDIKLRASRVMADVPEGGGGPSASTILWGRSNTLFDDVDTVSRTLGNVSIRQAFLHVDTDNTDRLLGSYALVAKMPQDPNVAVTLAACEPFARRSQISDAIANYLIKGVPWNGLLLGDHVQGQANIQLLQRPGTALPTIGRTLVLVVDEGKPTERTEWVRIIKAESEVRTFTDSIGDWQGMVVRCDLASGLSQALPGTDPTRYYTRANAAAAVRDTTAADAANYYGAAALRAAAAMGDSTVSTTGVYGQLVPSSATAVPALDQRPAAQRSITLAQSPRLIEVPATPHMRRIKIGQENRGLSYIAQLTPLPEPGTVTITWVGLGNRQTVVDDGHGALSGAGAGTLNGSTGSLAVTLPSLPDVGSAIVISWGERVAYTNRSGQGAQVRRPEYVWELDGEGMLHPGSLTIGYPSGGQIYTCTVAANGTIGGDGAGHVDNASKTVQLRPTHMPDAGGQFLCEYQLVSTVTDILTPGTPDAGGFIQGALTQQPAAGTLRVAWATAQEVSTTSGGTMHAESYAKNNFAAAGRITANRIAIPAPQYTAIRSSVIGGAGGGGGAEAGISTGAPSFMSGGIAMVPTKTTSATDARSVYTTQSEQDSATRIIAFNTITDDGLGSFGFGMGTVDYAGQAFNLKVVTFGRSTTSYKADHERMNEFNRTVGSPTGNQSTSTSGTINKGGEYGTTSVADMVLAGSSVVATYSVGTAQPVAHSMAYTPPEVVIDLCPYTTDRIVPGSIQFAWMGTTYQDREGVIYRDATDTSPGIIAGVADYAAGTARMTDYVVAGSPHNFVLQSLWTQKGEWRTASAFFMTGASPIQPGQITITVLDVAGTALQIDCDLNGNLSGPHARGKFEFQAGLAELQFGDYVLDSALTPEQKTEWWYDPALVGEVEAGKIWRPWPVDPASLRYNAVSNLYLPVDPQILGLDPVRLPQDGRVPIFRKGRMICIGHNATLPPASYSNGQTIDCGRTRLSHVWLIDANGALINEGFTATEADLDAGLIHVTNTAGWAQPVTVEHRIQDMRLTTDVQIDGTVSLNFPLSHNFPAGSVASSVLLFGTIFARVANLFDQHTWDGITWADSVTGNPAVGTYNAGAYPIAVTNAGALTERYALRFKSDGTNFELIGQHSGGLGEGSRNLDFTPANPFNPSVPLFALQAAGWGSGWVAGNVQFLRLEAAMPSFAVIRTVQPSQAAGTDYSFDLLAGGDVDRPPSAP